jgi:hypothetical protein
MTGTLVAFARVCAAIGSLPNENALASARTANTNNQGRLMGQASGTWAAIGRTEATVHEPGGGRQAAAEQSGLQLNVQSWAG